MKGSKVSKELSSAAYDDFKRKAVDAAKKRAVAQNVDYDTFKAMVSVAHLRPLQAPSVNPQGSWSPAWFFTADGQRSKPGQLEALAASQALLLSKDVPQEPPSSSADFTRCWRRSCPSADHKYRYLQLCGPQVLAAVFKTEISSELLKDIISVLNTCWLGHTGFIDSHVQETNSNATSQTGGAADSTAPEDQCNSETKAASSTRHDQQLQEVQEMLTAALWVIQVLAALSTAGRFKLALQMIGSQGKQAVQCLLDQVQEAITVAQQMFSQTSEAEHIHAADQQTHEASTTNATCTTVEPCTQGNPDTEAHDHAGMGSAVCSRRNDVAVAESSRDLLRQLHSIYLDVHACFGLAVAK